MNTDTLIKHYLKAKQMVIDAGYLWEIEHVDSLKTYNLTESIFLREMIWVILCSGFRVSVIENKWKDFERVFYKWNRDYYIYL